VLTGLKRLWQSRMAETTPAFRAGFLPPATRIYAIGDVHGCLHLLADLERRIVEDARAHPGPTDQRLILLGDYVDRGPDSRGVLDHLLVPAPRGFQRTLLMGNHDWWLVSFVEDGSDPMAWLVSGGEATLRSYGVALSGDPTEDDRFASIRRQLLRRMPAAHRRLLRGMERYVQVGDYLFVHAGIRPGLPLGDQALHDLMFIREPFLSDPDHRGTIVVHGHTVVAEPEVRHNRIGIDTGAYRSGRLTALVVEPAGIRFLSTGD
jgi:serine/threonine protein phosphatase 1